VYTKDVADMIVFARKGVRIAEAWFDEEPEQTGVDIIRQIQHPSPVSAAKCDAFPTILLDLRQSHDELAAGMKKDARYAIRRAEQKDNLEWSWADVSNHDVFHRFCELYNGHANRKGLLLLDDPTIARLKMYAARKLFCLTEIKAQDMTSLTWHAYIVSPPEVKTARRARLLYSLSLRNGNEDSARTQLIGRANRFHHWRDIERFKADGFDYYDFGGWYGGNEDQERLKINKFKEEFGGTFVTDYDCEHPVSFKGRLYLTTRSLLRRVRK